MQKLNDRSKKVFTYLLTMLTVFQVTLAKAEIYSATENRYIRFKTYEDKYVSIQSCEFDRVTVPGYGPQLFRKTTSCKNLGNKNYYLIEDIVHSRRVEAWKTFGKSAGVAVGTVAGAVVGIVALIAVNPLAVAGYASLASAGIAVGGGALGGGATSAAAINPAKNYRAWKSFGEEALNGKLLVESVAQYEDLIRSHLVGY